MRPSKFIRRNLAKIGENEILESENYLIIGPEEN